MEPRSQGPLVKVGGNRDLGRRDSPTGEEQREKEGEILQLFTCTAAPWPPTDQAYPESEGAWEM